MVSILLMCIIYTAFIGLGLPDSLLGAAWPIMQQELNAPLSAAGTLSMLITFCTIISSLSSNHITQKFSTGTVTALSTALTAVAMLGFSVSDSFTALCLWSIPFGLGAGAIDAALNNFAALHFSSKHMSWLHAFWGVGVTISPYIMRGALSGPSGWQDGYRIISLMQFALAALFLLSLPLWKRAQGERSTEKTATHHVTLRQVVRIPGVPHVLLAFLAYCSFEATAGLWASSYLVGARGLDAKAAAGYAALFYIGETSGRFLNGFAAEKFGDRTMVKVGILTVLGGIALLALPFASPLPALIGLVVTGFGAAPVYPCIVHATPDNFGRENSQAIVGIQMASAYCGSALTPVLFGLVAEHISIALYPLFLSIFAALVLVMIERSIHHIQANRSRTAHSRV